MPAGEHGKQQVVNHGLLPDDDFAEFSFEFCSGLAQFVNGLAFAFIGVIHYLKRMLLALV